MSLSKPSITQAWRCILSSMHFIGDSRLTEKFDRRGYHNRGYGAGNGKLGSKDETNVGSGFSNSRGNTAPGHKSFESGGQFGRSHRSQSQNNGGRGHKHISSRLRVNSKRRGFEDGFRMPDFDPGNDQLNKIFESQMDSSDPISELDLGDGGPIEGNFGDGDGSEAENFYKNA